MTYEYADKAQREADQYAIAGVDLDRLLRASEGLGPVRHHTIRFQPDAWTGLLGALPALAKPGQIMRGEVIGLAKQVLTEGRKVEDLFTTAYIWGWGETGFGYARYQRIMTGARRRGIDVSAALTTAVSALRDVGPIKAYELLFGGTEAKKRRPVGSPGVARLPEYGPAFFTKLLYFTASALTDLGGWHSDPPALILDIQLAQKVKRLSGMPYLTRDNGTRNEWSCYRYAVYLSWMAQTAKRAGIAPDELEHRLFRSTI